MTLVTEYILTRRILGFSASWFLQHDYFCCVKLAVIMFVIPVSTIIVAVTFEVIAYAIFLVEAIAATELIRAPAWYAMSNSTFIPIFIVPFSAEALSTPMEYEKMLSKRCA